MPNIYYISFYYIIKYLKIPGWFLGYYLIVTESVFNNNLDLIKIYNITKDYAKHWDNICYI